MTIREIGRRLRNGETSCTRLVEETLTHIKTRDTYRSFITITEEAALAEAAELDREIQAEIDRGPLHGVPIAHKDLFYTAGVRTTAGSLLFRDFIPNYDATVVARLKGAGVVCIGKTNLHELAYGITSKNPHYGYVLNPRDPARLAGGSSGGSAALVAAGLLPMCLGSDTGGSIRIPASFCGTVGLKPTYGRVSRRGVLPLAFSLDTVGPLGSCVEDCALTMNIIAGADSHDPSSAQVPVSEFNLPPASRLNGFRIGVPENYFFESVDEEVAAAVRRAIGEAEELDGVLVPVTLPDMNQASAAARILQLSETTALYASHTDPAMFGEDTWALIQQGRLISAHDYVNAQRLRTLFRGDFDKLWKEIDVLITPTTPTVAPLMEETKVVIAGKEEDTRLASTRLVRPVNLLGEPAISLPCGKSASGLPVGLQIIAAPFEEPKLLRFARTLEERLSAFL